MCVCVHKQLRQRKIMQEEVERRKKKVSAHILIFPLHPWLFSLTRRVRMRYTRAGEVCIQNFTFPLSFSVSIIAVQGKPTERLTQSKCSRLTKDEKWERNVCCACACPCAEILQWRNSRRLAAPGNQGVGSSPRSCGGHNEYLPCFPLLMIIWMVDLKRKNY